MAGGWFTHLDYLRLSMHQYLPRAVLPRVGGMPWICNYIPPLVPGSQTHAGV